MSQTSSKSASKHALRSPSKVMRLNRMGSFHQSRLSFMRVLLRRLRTENWQFDRPIFEIDEKGVGVATYRATGPKRSYTLVAFAHDLPAEKRSDRVIADAWDATFALFDGDPTREDIKRLSGNVPLQEAGRVSEKEFVLSRANKSVRLFNHILESLAIGKQPDPHEITKVGYLMRTTAVYGSGKFGAADRTQWAEREEFSGSFQPELLAVWFIRQFAIDWVEHLARQKGGDEAVALAPALRRQLGIGNSTGLGMAPFLLNHPSLIHAWINAREEAIARVCDVQEADENATELFKNFVSRIHANCADWHTDHPYQKDKLASLIEDWKRLDAYLANFDFQQTYPWRVLMDWAEENLDLEAQEQLASLMLEPYGHLVDELASAMHSNEEAAFRIDGGRTIEQLKAQLSHHYSWAMDIDFSKKPSMARVWYTSAEKLEPRLGERFEEDISSYEQPLAPARDAIQMMDDLSTEDDQSTIAEFLMKHPDHRHMVRRMQILENCPYGEIRDNTIDANMLPIDLLRCKLSFFGATRFDPRSDRWVRITMYQGAPYPDELQSMDPDDCQYPVLVTQ